MLTRRSKWESQVVSLMLTLIIIFLYDHFPSMKKPRLLERPLKKRPPAAVEWWGHNPYRAKSWRRSFNDKWNSQPISGKKPSSQERKASKKLSNVQTGIIQKGTNRNVTESGDWNTNKTEFALVSYYYLTLNLYSHDYLWTGSEL